MVPVHPDLILRLRPRLEDQLRAVLSRHDRLSAHLTNADRPLPGDWPDRAAITGHDEVLEALDGHARDEIVAIRAALRRMDAGSYGACAGCGEAIPPARLEALPTVSTCTGCASSLS